LRHQAFTETLAEAVEVVEVVEADVDFEVDASAVEMAAAEETAVAVMPR
jgi:hypothetical protein